MKLARIENGFEFKVKKKKQQREKRRSEAHPKVNYRQYYELIDSDLSDPSRLSILLYWVSKHCKSKEQDPALEKVKQEILEKLKTKSINLNWYQSIVQQQRQENPINVQNALKLEEFQEQIEQYFNLT